MQHGSAEREMHTLHQKKLHMEGLFGVRATPFGANLVLLETYELKNVGDYISGNVNQAQEWFNEIKPWEPKDVDRERLIWIKCYDVLCHAWSEDFFEKLGLAYGAFMYTNEHIKDKEHLDIGKFVMKTTHNIVINEVVKVKINDNIFHIKLVKEGCKECLNYFGCRNRRHKDSATFEELEDYKEEDKLNNNEDGQVGDLIPNFNFEIQNEKASKPLTVLLDQVSDLS